ncbi:hypothetical protein C1881_07110 [Slackia isoflavoniconvertens]|uniref:ATP-dependent Clp protease proteolytic subunit n=2 Tax=Slackia isoflavoniconvertens TaxID=572010 RepID=A0A369LHP7_9ACTN|nr:hypothetical protein C1881_07110 [Slackia isoflavoniconvertens]
MGDASAALAYESRTARRRVTCWFIFSITTEYEDASRAEWILLSLRAFVRPYGVLYRLATPQITATRIAFAGAPSLTHTYSVFTPLGRSPMSTFSYSPQITQETALGLERFDMRDEMLACRELELCGPVDAESVADIIRGLRHLQKADPATPITLFINSPGGEVQSGLALYDVMSAISCPVRTVCLGLAASMAALLFIAGDTRAMLPHSRVMIHDPLIGGAGVGGSALSVKARADDLMRIRDITAQVIAEHTGMPLERVFELTARDTYFEAEEAVAAHLADRVIREL